MSGSAILLGTADFGSHGGLTHRDCIAASEQWCAAFPTLSLGLVHESTHHLLSTLLRDGTSAGDHLGRTFRDWDPGRRWEKTMHQPFSSDSTVLHRDMRGGGKTVASQARW